MRFHDILSIQFVWKKNALWKATENPWRSPLHFLHWQQCTGRSSTSPSGFWIYFLLGQMVMRSEKKSRKKCGWDEGLAVISFNPCRGWLNLPSGLSLAWTRYLSAACSLHHDSTNRLQLAKTIILKNVTCCLADCMNKTNIREIKNSQHLKWT